MQIYNSATHRKEEFVPREPGKVAMYACGPTVYNHIHIGNARTFLTFDVVRRYLAYRGYEVTFVQNVTDVDDKIINRAKEEGRTAAEVAADYTQLFIDAMHRFGIQDPDVRPRATQEIPEMIALVERLIAAGHAYEVDGDVYFAVRSFKPYGELSGRNIDELQAGARVDVDERKRDPLDFALWKAAKPGEPMWDSPWGKGRPGWHLECSAMSEKYLGLPIDIHGGGSDLCFPHHENEKAQSEAAGGGQFVRYWLHGGMLNINHEKMSKSLGNFLLLKDVLEQCDPNALRVLMLQTHYRSPLDFSDARLAEAGTSYERLVGCVRNARWAAENGASAGADAADEVSLATGSPCGEPLRGASILAASPARDDGPESASASCTGSLATGSPCGEPLRGASVLAASPARDDESQGRHPEQRDGEAVGASPKDPEQNASRSDAQSSPDAGSSALLPDALRSAFIAAMDDDFNTAGALGVIFGFVADVNRFIEEHPQPSAEDAAVLAAAADAIEELLGVLGIQAAAAEEWPVEVCELAASVCGYEGADPHAAVDALLAARAAARAEKNWAVADSVRDGLTGLGFTIEDTASGARVSYGS